MWQPVIKQIYDDDDDDDEYQYHDTNIPNISDSSNYAKLSLIIMSESEMLPFESEFRFDNHIASKETV